MIGLAVRVGFIECRRESGACEVRGKKHDAVRFVLSADRLRSCWPWLDEAVLT